MKEIGRFLANKAFSKMGQKYDSNAWTDEFHQIVNEVNAFYHRYLNQFVIAAAYLQGVYYGYDRPMYLNFGASGTTIGHEIIHGFDSNGRNYDKNGKAVLIGFW